MVTGKKTITVREPSGCLLPIPIGKKHTIELTDRLGRASGELLAAYDQYQLARMLGVNGIKVGGINSPTRTYYVGLFDEANRVMSEELKAQGIKSDAAFCYTVAKEICKTPTVSR